MPAAHLSGMKTPRIPAPAGRGRLVVLIVAGVVLVLLVAFKSVGAKQDGANSRGMVTLGGKYYLTCLKHHTWTTNKKGEKVRGTGSYEGVEGYKIPADLVQRVEAKETKD